MRQKTTKTDAEGATELYEMVAKIHRVIEAQEDSIGKLVVTVDTLLSVASTLLDQGDLDPKDLKVRVDVQGVQAGDLVLDDLLQMIFEFNDAVREQTEKARKLMASATNIPSSKGRTEH
jgi:hypothetical protein